MSCSFGGHDAYAKPMWSDSFGGPDALATWMRTAHEAANVAMSDSFGGPDALATTGSASIAKNNVQSDSFGGPDALATWRAISPGDFVSLTRRTLSAVPMPLQLVSQIVNERALFRNGLRAVLLLVRTLTFARPRWSVYPL